MALVAGQLHGLGERHEQPSRDALDIVDLTALVEDHHELVAAEACDNVGFPQRTAQPAPNFEQEQIASLMAERIVDDLEAVEIDEQHRETVIVALSFVDRLPQQPVEGLAVRQVGQAVMRGEVFDPLVGLVLLVGAIEILHREGDVVGEALQQLDELGREGLLLGRHVDHDADGLVVRDQRERRAGARAVALQDGMEGAHTAVIDIVVADTGLPGAERGAAHAAPLGPVGVDGKTNVPRGLGGRPCGPRRSRAGRCQPWRAQWSSR
ncbi:hypothetical protein AB7M70_008075 [Bradyrhizobium japonicum]